MAEYYYLIVENMPGYLPESEPYVFECEDDFAPLPQVCRELYSRVQAAGDDSDLAAWDAVLNRIDDDRDNAANLSENGVRYVQEGTHDSHGEAV